MTENQYKRARAIKQRLADVAKAIMILQNVDDYTEFDVDFNLVDGSRGRTAQALQAKINKLQDEFDAL